MLNRRAAFLLLAASSVVVASVSYGCSDDETRATSSRGPALDGGRPDGAVAPDAAKADSASPAAIRARATLQPTGLGDAGSTTGAVDFEEKDGTVTVTVQIAGATPGDHGMHIHANGSCDTNDAGPAGAAGPHWNPPDAGHGFPTATPHHPGDFGNVMISATSTGTLSLTTKDFTVQPNGTALSAIDHAVILHQGADDGTTQPTGSSGGRAGCGVIKTLP